MMVLSDFEMHSFNLSKVALRPSTPRLILGLKGARNVRSNLKRYMPMLYNTEQL